MNDFNFHDAPVKGEGQMVTGYGPVTKPKIKTTWLEVRIPEDCESHCMYAIEAVLRIHGYEKGWMDNE